MGNTVLRVNQPSLRYLYPLCYSHVPPLFLFFHLLSSSACLFGTQIYKNPPLVPLVQHTPFNFVANYCFEAEATANTAVKI